MDEIAIGILSELTRCILSAFDCKNLHFFDIIATAIAEKLPSFTVDCADLTKRQYSAAVMAGQSNRRNAIARSIAIAKTAQQASKWLDNWQRSLK